MKFSTVTIYSDDHGIRLDRFFKRYYKDLHFTLIAKLVRKKLIKLNGKRADISTKLSQGDVLTFPIIEINTAHQEPSNATNHNLDRYANVIKDSVIYEDENIIVINKPYGLAVQGGSKIKVSVDDLSIYLQKDYPEKPKLVHRIDKDTTGLLVLARSSSIASKVSELIKSKNFHKIYLALCLNEPTHLSGKIDSPLSKVNSDYNGYEKVSVHDKGKQAITFYQVLDYAANKYSLIEAKIITGRTHQIRVHLSSIGCPIVGDDKYGIEDNLSNVIQNKLYLHAYRLEFELLGQKYKFNAPLPVYFTEALNNLGLDVNNKI